MPRRKKPSEPPPTVPPPPDTTPSLRDHDLIVGPGSIPTQPALRRDVVVALRMLRAKLADDLAALDRVLAAFS